VSGAIGEGLLLKEWAEMSDNYLQLPADLPAPLDDDAARGLCGRVVPSIPLAATDGSFVDLSKQIGRTVVYAFPMTGRPGVPLPDGWDAIPGARGCTPQACSFRDHFRDIRSAGAAQLFGLSTQERDYQREARDRLHLPFELLSDAGLTFASALGLPTFEIDGVMLLKRLTLIVDDGVVTHVFYPVFPPDRSAADVLAWLRGHIERGRNPS
jgi:peroxiredoxin